MSDGIFVLQGEQLVEMREQPYDSEDIFQALLAKYPNLLAGGQMNRQDPRRWLLISREITIPSEQDGGGRWSLDHLFLDQDAIPTLVEVKRSSDTRIRREVVGQMLDYAANAVSYWPVEKMRAEFEARCKACGFDSDKEIAALVGNESNPDQFWQMVKTNLQAGKIRMVFVADSIPTELQRIVEFLNLQMDPAEVLAVEIKQYVGEGLKTLVPRVIGQTIEAEDRKSVAKSTGKQWDEDSFVGDLAERKGPAIVAIAKRILEWSRDRGLTVWWGQGSRDGTFVPYVVRDGEKHFLVGIWSNGYVEIQFQYMSRRPFSDSANRRELLGRLNSIPGVSLPADAVARRPSIPLAIFDTPASLQQLLDTLDWAVQMIKQN